MLVQVAGTTLALTSTSAASGSTLNAVSSAAAGFTGNVLLGTAGASGTGNLLLLEASGSPVFQVQPLALLLVVMVASADSCLRLRRSALEA